MDRQLAGGTLPWRLHMASSVLGKLRVNELLGVQIAASNSLSLVILTQSESFTAYS
jgi:hypothetical protein